MQVHNKYALIGFSVAALWKLSIYSMGLQHSTFAMYFLYFPILVLLVCLFFGIRENRLRNSAPDRLSSIKQDLKTGVRITLIFSLLFSVFIYVYYTWIDKYFFAQKIEARMEELRATGIPADQLDQHYQTMVNFIFAADKQSLFTMIGYCILGVFYSLILSVLFNRTVLRGF